MLIDQAAFHRYLVAKIIPAYFHKVIILSALVEFYHSKLNIEKSIKINKFILSFKKINLRSAILHFRFILLLLKIKKSQVVKCRRAL